ncbi:MAG: nitroreductase [Rhodobacterales bacterium]|nr:MAG: nitroreductase [Rhodobacterales bacterium]
MTPNPTVMDFLLNRRSRIYKTLTTPVPSNDELRPLLTAAARVPDHGILNPWRFIVLRGAALKRLAELTKTRGAELGMDPDKVAKTAAMFENAGLIVTVVSAPHSLERIPEVEQFYSAGASCLSLMNAAQASGWGANWISGWTSHDREFIRQGLGLADDETVAGYIHIGSETTVPSDRRRPDVETLIEWVEQ